MEQFGGPAALGGVITGLMLVAWTIGRWQGTPGAAGGREHAAPTPRSGSRHDKARVLPEGDLPARRCQEAARAERRAVLASTAALGKLHEDISAYRHAQRLLSDAEAMRLPAGWSTTREGEPCRYLGVSGHPTCPTAAVAPVAPVAPCTCGTCALARKGAAARLGQPSREPSALTRV